MYFPKEHPRLLTKDLLLKQVEPEDLAELEMIISYRRNDDLTAKQLLSYVNKQFNEQTSINWGFYLNEKLIGTVGFYRGFANNTGEIGYVTIEDYRKKGYTLQAVKRILVYGLEVMRLDNVVAYTSPGNKASQALLRKLNFDEVRSDHPEDLKFALHMDME